MMPQDFVSTLVALLVLFTPLGSPLLAQQPPVSPNPDFVAALWIAHNDGMLKLVTADWSILFEIPDAVDLRALAIDDRNGVVWGVGRNRLNAFAFNGDPILSVPVGDTEDAEDDDDSGTSHLALTANAVNGTIWLGVGKPLSHFDGAGRLLHTVSSSSTSLKTHATF